MTIRLAQFLKMIEMDPDDALMRFGAGKALLDEGRAAEAVEHLQACVRLNPEYSAAYRLLGQALEREGQPQEAAEAFRRGLEVAEAKGDLQTAKEIRVFLNRLGE